MLFLQVLGQKRKMRTKGKKADRNFHKYTEVKMANTMAVVNNSLSQKVSATTFLLPPNTLVSKCLRKQPSLRFVRQT